MPLRKLIIPLALTLASVSSSHAGTADSSYKSALEQWRQDSEQRLRAPYGVLSIVGLFWLHDGNNRIGSHPASEVPLPPDVAPARLGVVKVEGGTTSLEVSADAPVSVNGARVKTALLANDGKSTKAAVEIGRLKLSLINSEQGQAIQVSDPNSALRRDFAGQQWFPVDEDWRVPGHYVAYPQAKIIPYDSAVGGTRSAPSPGYVTFVRDGHEYSLDVLEENAEGRVAFFFDATTGKTTYAGGRVVPIEKGEDDGVTLDFNKAFNRPCAVSPFTVCRIAPEQNRLKVLEVRAGEKKPLIKVQRVASAPDYIK
ncbi:DUF1684 domain-containing protein [Propionivibrio sp.]|uniref:DUF1684 domain-containing protein n=1 Tax=Propionivibrio sp. TaxID=2212460 RepID=UPI002605E7EF|nr:DUF1684 domain-containing protein [Propionivibrio sp.]